MNRPIASWLLGLCLCIGGTAAAREHPSAGIEQIDIINWTHTDYGFTDHPLIARELYLNYIDIALDYVERSRKNPPGEQFTWTVESLDPLAEWWRQAPAERRRLLLQAIDRGNIDVNVMPFNIHPLLNDTEIDRLLHWIPEPLYARFRPRIAVQNDVNGFPRAVADRLRTRDVRYVWLGMNGRHPFPIPTLSWWEMPDGHRLLLWNGGAYWEAYDYLGIVHWKAHPREAADPTTRWPRPGEIFPADEASVRRAHAQCVKKIERLEAEGYPHSVLPLSFSNVWRGDNDGPYWGIVAFVRKWNELGLKPALCLSTATASMERLEREMPEDTPVLHGEFGDWWAFGMTSLPRETATARKARYLLQASVSPLFGTSGNRVAARTEQVNRDLCTFYEHTFASKTSNSDIYGEFNQGSMNEANRYAYRAYEYARWQLAQRVRCLLGDAEEGVYVLNTQQTPFSGWVRTEFSALRDRKAIGVTDPSTGETFPFVKVGGTVRFWVDSLPGRSTRRYALADEAAPTTPAGEGPEVRCDAEGWPVAVRWPGMERPLFEGEIGEFLAYRMTSGGWWGGDGVLEPAPTTPAGPVKVTQEAHATIYTQRLANDRLVSLERVLEVYRAEPRVRLRVVYDRKLHPAREKEIFYVQIPLPADERATLTTSNGGMPFAPYRDNIPNTCKRFYAVDSWVAYGTEEGSRVWSSRTSPIVSFGDNPFFLRGDAERPQDAHLLRSMVYNNSWGLNFPVEYGGEVVCEYDLYWTPRATDPDEIRRVTDTYLVEPVLSIVPREREDAAYRRWMNGEGR